MQMESLIPKENIFFGDNLIFLGGTYGWTYRGMYGQGGGDHMSTYHLSSFSTVQWGISLAVRILFLGYEVLGQHGMTSWLPM